MLVLIGLVSLLLATTAPMSLAAKHVVRPAAVPHTLPKYCTKGYKPCLKKDPSDYDCYGGGGNGPAYTKPGVVYKVWGADPYGLDSDNDGQGCE